MKEKRQFTRIVFDADATLSNEQGSWDTQVIDISLKGALVDVPADADIQTDSHVKLTLTLSDATTHIYMQGRVSHYAGDRLGIACEHMDVESVSHLRRLVELNIGDDTLLERELEALANAPD